MSLGNPHRVKRSQDSNSSTVSSTSVPTETVESTDPITDHPKSSNPTMGKGLSPSKPIVQLNKKGLIDLQHSESLFKKDPELDNESELALETVPTPWLKNLVYFVVAMIACTLYLVVIWAINLLQQLPGGLVIWGTLGALLGLGALISCFRLFRLWQTLPTQKGQSLEKHLRHKKSLKPEKQTKITEAWFREHQKNLKDLQHPLRRLYQKYHTSVDASILAIDQALLDLSERPELWHRELAQRSHSPSQTIDRLAKDIILSHAKHLGLKTAALPKGWLDTLAVIWNLTDLCRELGLLYGIRTGKTDTFKLLSMGLQHILLASQLDHLDQHIINAWAPDTRSAAEQVSSGAETTGGTVGEFLSQSEGLHSLLGSLLGTFVGKALEGTANALLCMRFGFALKKILSR